jgi:hypothetical protein
MLDARQYESIDAKTTTRPETNRRHRSCSDQDRKILTGAIEEDTMIRARIRFGQGLARPGARKEGRAAGRDKLAPERRREIARNVAAKRWSNGKQ